ncbi:MAG: RNA 3'-terminal phosphate cyclase [Candidatus Pacearchaeota archaeon]
MNEIIIDGSYGSGGGQILRTSLALSLLTQRPFILKNIRANRPNPGLAAQHLACIKIAKILGNADVKNDYIGSKEIYFAPKNLEFKDINIDIGTAGSISLVLQTIMPCLIKAEKFKARIIGGTDVSFAPPIDYTKYVFLELLKKIGYEAKIEIIRRGFYPKGKGIVDFNFLNVKLKHNNFNEKGKIKCIKGNAVASEKLKQKKVVEKLINFSEEEIKKEPIFNNIPLNLNGEYVNTESDGAVLCLWLEAEKSIIGVSALGELRKSSEIIAKEVIEKLKNEFNGVIDSHAADQILPFLAYITTKFKKETILKTSFITEHAITNAWVIEKFLPVSFDINHKEGIIKIKEKLET